MLVQFLGSNLALGLALIGVVAALAYRARGPLRDMLRARQPAWRALAGAFCGATLALLLWGTLADNWRKMVGEALDFRERFASQRIVVEPVAGDVRAVTLVLLAVSLLAAAPLFARYVGGYGLQIATIITGFAAFVPLYLIRQRLDTGLAGIFELPPLFSLAMLATIVFLLTAYLTNVALLLAIYLGLLGLVAVPVTIALDLLGRRDPPPDPAPATFYASLHDHIPRARNAEHGTANAEQRDERPAD